MRLISAPYSCGTEYPTVSGMFTVRAPAATTAFEICSRYSGAVRAPSSAENSTSSTWRRASSTAATASSSTCSCDFLSLYFRSDLLEVFRGGARAVFGRKLHVVHVAASQFHGGHGLLQHLLLRLLELVFPIGSARGIPGRCARRLRPKTPRRPRGGEPVPRRPRPPPAPAPATS